METKKYEYKSIGTTTTNSVGLKLKKEYKDIFNLSVIQRNKNANIKVEDNNKILNEMKNIDTYKKKTPVIPKIKTFNTINTINNELKTKIKSLSELNKKIKINNEKLTDTEIKNYQEKYFSLTSTRKDLRKTEENLINYKMLKLKESLITKLRKEPYEYYTTNNNDIDLSTLLPKVNNNISAEKLIQESNSLKYYKNKYPSIFNSTKKIFFNKMFVTKKPKIILTNNNILKDSFIINNYIKSSNKKYNTVFNRNKRLYLSIDNNRIKCYKNTVNLNNHNNIKNNRNILTNRETRLIDNVKYIKNKNILLEQILQDVIHLKKDNTIMAFNNNINSI